MWMVNRDGCRDRESGLAGSGDRLTADTGELQVWSQPLHGGVFREHWRLLRGGPGLKPQPMAEWSEVRLHTAWNTWHV